MALGPKTRRGLMWAAWTVLCLSLAMWAGLKTGRPLFYSDGIEQVAGGDVAGAGMLQWRTPEAEFELPGKLTGRAARLADGRWIYGVLGEDGTSDLVTWDPEQPDVPPEPAYGLNSDDNELAPAVGPDGRVYFASDRAESVGGYDLFVAQSNARGFGRVEPLVACNTFLDESDPAPDPSGESLVFVRIDRAIDRGQDGVLWRWRLGDVLDPEALFADQQKSPRKRSVDRDPVWANDGRSLWFVRKQRGKPLAVCRSSRLGDLVDVPVVLSGAWSTKRLRSPLPLADGRRIAFVQPAGRGEAAGDSAVSSAVNSAVNSEANSEAIAAGDSASADGEGAQRAGDEDLAAALVYVSEAQELVPWWPGQSWLEWLLLSFAICALLLLLLLYFGQRWSALDLVAQCLLFSLLLHVLLFLWLMGVEIAGSLLPGRDDEDSGMQVSIIASTGASAAAQSAAAMRGGDVAARIERPQRERSFDVETPDTTTAMAERQASQSLEIESGSYQVQPEAAAERAATRSAELADAAQEIVPEAGRDAMQALAAAEIAQVEAARHGAQDTAARSSSNRAALDARTVQVATPGSGSLPASARPIAAGSSSVAQALPVPGAAESRSDGPAAPLLQDQAAAAVVASAAESADAAASDAAESKIEPSLDLASAQLAPSPSANAATQPGNPSRRVAAAVGGARRSAERPLPTPSGSLARSARRGPIAAGRPVRAAALAKPTAGRSRSPAPSVVLAGPATLPNALAGTGASRAPGQTEPSPTSRSLTAAASTDPSAPAAPAAAAPARQASSSAPGKARVEPLTLPGSALAARSRPSIDTGSRAGASGLPMATASGRRGGPVGVQLRGLQDIGKEAGDVVADSGKPAAADGRNRASSGSRLQRIAEGLPDSPSRSASFAPRRGSERRRGAGAFAERFAVEAPGTRVLGAPRRRSAMPQPSQPTLAATPYSNRFGPAKAKALERFGGTEQTERAVRSGLRYLASVQNRDGSWGNRGDFDGKYGFVYVGKTALCTLAFLGAGHTPTSKTQYSSNVRRAVQHLLALQEERTGAFGRSSCYGHGITTYALAECYGLTKDKALVRPLEDALAWILANQGPRRDARNRGGWGYFSPGLDREDSYARVSVSSWMIMALESARLSGVELPKDSLPLARQYLELSYDRPNGWFRYNHKPRRLRSGWPTLPASTPAAAFCLMLLGMGKDDSRIEAAVDYTVERRPRRYRRYGDNAFVLEGQGNVYFWYYGSLCCFLKGGEAWERWNARLSTVLPAAQAEDGSFPPIDVYAEEAGDTRQDRSYTTAMCVLSLEVYYRYFTPLLLGR
ncbi:MAG: hypothetical protein AB8H80_22065 [Planctomycetota bacterium]